MDVAIIWNAGASCASALEPEEVRARVAAAMHREVELICADDPCAATRDAIGRGARVIVAAGGDGTVSACAAEAMGKAQLGILPLGTSNSFAAALEIPDDLDGAIATLGSTERRVLDAAHVTAGAERRVMILHCMIGLHAETIAETAPEAKRRWGALAYAMTGLKKLAGASQFAVELTTADHVVRCKAIAIAVANIAPHKTVLAHGPSHLLADDGRVDVTIVAADSIAEAIATGVHLYRSAREGQPATRDNVGSFASARVEVRAEPAQCVLVDGEQFGETPVIIETLPRALVVIASTPAQPDGEQIPATLFGLPELDVSDR